MVVLSELDRARASHALLDREPLQGEVYFALKRLAVRKTMTRRSVRFDTIMFQPGW